MPYMPGLGWYKGVGWEERGENRNETKPRGLKLLIGKFELQLQVGMSDGIRRGKRKKKQ